MTPQRFSRAALHEVPSLRTTDTIDTAVRQLLDAGYPALPVVDERERFVGIFGEREFMAALFPGYVDQLRHAGFIRHELDEAIERRVGCRAERVSEHMNTEHIAVDEDFSDVQIAEIFLHHRVLIIPVVRQRRIVGVIARGDFFRTIAQRLLDAPG